MENPKKNSGHYEIPKNPQPSDQLQMEIETVTPDTEKEVKPSTASIDVNENNNGDNGKDDLPVAEEDARDNEFTKQRTEEESQMESANDEMKPVSGKSSGSPADDIETVSP